MVYQNKLWLLIEFINPQFNQKDIQNELPMNGGKMNGIVGFDSLDSQYDMIHHL